MKLGRYRKKIVSTLLTEDYREKYYEKWLYKLKQKSYGPTLNQHVRPRREGNY